jgi:dienelactone hydrolase
MSYEPSDGGRITRELFVWYPGSTPEERFDYAGQIGFAAKDGVAAERRFAAVVFSHGFLGAGDQSIFLTENLARMGYVVVAPNHADASTRRRSRIEPPRFADPCRWDDQKYADRRADIVAVLDWLSAENSRGDSFLYRRIDTERIGAVGHSLGGYAVLGLAGLRASWREPRIRAVVGLSPYVLPYLCADAKGLAETPILLQGGTFDWGITPSLDGFYARLPAPKYFLVLKGENHFGWTNLIALGKTTTQAVQSGNARWMTGYTLAFLDQYLNGHDRSSVLERGNRALHSFEFAGRE